MSTTNRNAGGGLPASKATTPTGRNIEAFLRGEKSYEDALTDALSHLTIGSDAEKQLVVAGLTRKGGAR